MWFVILIYLVCVGCLGLRYLAQQAQQQKRKDYILWVTTIDEGGKK